MSNQQHNQIKYSFYRISESCFSCS